MNEKHEVKPTTLTQCSSPIRERFYGPKVSFNLKPKIHYLYAWDFAYRQARKSNWMQLSADRERFKQKILKFEKEGKF